MDRQDQQAKLLKLMEVIPHLRSHLSGQITVIDKACQEAKVEENDYTGHSVDDLEYELGLAEVGVKQKIAFVENQVNTTESFRLAIQLTYHRWLLLPRQISPRPSSRSSRQPSSTSTRMGQT